jgi:ribbon-helix-helix CopG family protein
MADNNGTQNATKRVNVIFPQEVYDTLQNLAKMQNITISQALRQAINISNLIVNADKDEKARILIDRGGKTQELKLVR